MKDYTVTAHWTDQYNGWHSKSVSYDSFAEAMRRFAGLVRHPRTVYVSIDRWHEEWGSVLLIEWDAQDGLTMTAANVESYAF